MAAPLEVATELLVVVDLAVEDDPRGPVLIADRLIPRQEVDDAQPAHPETHAGSEVHALAIRPAMSERGAHGVDVPFENRAAVEIDDSGDAAHRSLPQTGGPPVTLQDLPGRPARPSCRPLPSAPGRPAGEPSNPTVPHNMGQNAPAANRGSPRILPRGILGQDSGEIPRRTGSFPERGPGSRDPSDRRFLPRV